MKKSHAIAIAIGFLVPAIVGAEALGLTGKGIKLGLNMATVSGNDVPDGVEMKIGLSAGGFLVWSLNDAMAIQPELLFSQKGAGYDYSVETSLNANYLEIPVLFKWMPAMEGAVKPNLVIGPGLGILMSAEIDADGDTTDVKDDANTMDVGLILGVGADYALTQGKVTVDLRYEMGLTDTVKDNDGDPVTNSVISVLVGYAF